MTGLLLSIAAILAAVGLSAVLLGARRQRSPGSLRLAAALLVMAVLAGADRFALGRPPAWEIARTVSLGAEALLGPAWLLFAAGYARRLQLRGGPLLTRLLLVVSLLPALLALSPLQENFFFSPDFADERVLFLSRAAYWFYLCVILLLSSALYYLERAFLSLASPQRADLLYEVLGVGIILAATLLYYSQALLHRTIDMNLVPVRSLALLVGVGLCAFSRLRRGAQPEIVISREVVTRSAVVLVIGGYLLLLGGAGELLSVFGPQNQRVIFAAIAVLGALGIALLIFSERNRRKLNVFLHKHFYRHKYDYRSEWLKFTDRLSSAASLAGLQQAIVDSFCETFGRQGAMLYLRDDDSGSYMHKAARNLELPQACYFVDHPLAVSFHASDRVFNTADQAPAELDALRRQLAALGVELCVPLRYERRLEGFIFLGEPVNRGETLNFEDYDLMKVLARQATSVLLSQRLSAQLTTAREMAAIGKVSTFVIHDLKNHAANLSLMLANAREHIDNPEFQADMLESLEETLARIGKQIARLKNIRERRELAATPHDLVEVVRRGVKAAGTGAELDAAEAVMAQVDAAEIEKVVHNLVLNAHEAGGNGSVVVRVGRDDMPFFEVSDRGCGMTAEFIRTRLFEPFQTTKPNGFGVGLYHCRQIVEAHGGSIQVASTPGEGSSFRVSLPCPGP